MTYTFGWDHAPPIPIPIKLKLVYFFIFSANTGI